MGEKDPVDATLARPEMPHVVGAAALLIVANIVLDVVGMMEFYGDLGWLQRFSAAGFSQGVRASTLGLVLSVAIDVFLLTKLLDRRSWARWLIILPNGLGVLVGIYLLFTYPAFVALVTPVGIFEALAQVAIVVLLLSQNASEWTGSRRAS